MRRPPIRIRTFILGSLLVLMVVPAVAGGSAWLIERDREHANVHRKVSTAVAYLTAHRTTLRESATAQGFARLTEQLDLLAQLVLISKTPPGKDPIYTSPGLNRGSVGKQGKLPPGRDVDERLMPAGASKSTATLVADLFYRPPSRTTPALVGLVTGVIVFLALLALAVWLAGRWMVAPLAGLSAQVDKVAGGDLAIAVPPSRIGEVANIAQAIEGMAAALGESAERRAEADDARRFLVTGIAHDLRTPLFALRGHLQAIRSHLGDPAVHLARAEARADALERLIENLFAYTRDDYAQPALQIENVAIADVIQESAAGLDHAARVGDNALVLEGDRAIAVNVDRDRVKRALTNILDNALRYSPAGSPIHVEWSAVDNSTVHIVVRDHGPGIDPELLPHIFDPGIRGSPPTGGAGLGLAIARRLLEQQDATLTARNQPDGGAEVCVALPR
jgi:signal transduction histidine kinase